MSTEKKSRLGRGLDALIGGSEPDEQACKTDGGRRH